MVGESADAATGVVGSRPHRGPGERPAKNARRAAGAHTPNTFAVQSIAPAPRRMSKRRKGITEVVAAMFRWCIRGKDTGGLTRERAIYLACAGCACLPAAACRRVHVCVLGAFCVCAVSSSSSWVGMRMKKRRYRSTESTDTIRSLSLYIYIYRCISCLCVRMYNVCAHTPQAGGRVVCDVRS